MMYNLKKIIHFSIFFAKKDLKTRFAGNILGIIWIFLQPICLILIYFFVFSSILKIRISPTDTSYSFLPFLLTGLFPWLAFQEGSIKAGVSIIENSEAVKKISFPVAGLPIGVILSTYCIHYIAFFIFLCLYLVYLLLKGASISIFIIFIPFYLTFLLACTIGIGLFLAAISTYFRDFIQIFNLIFQVWFYATPIVYPFSMVPKKFHFFIKCNPITGLIESIRCVLFYNKLPINLYHLWSIIFSISILILGILVFKKLKIGFSDVL